MAPRIEADSVLVPISYALRLTFVHPRQALNQAEDEYAEQNPQEMEQEEEEEGEPEVQQWIPRIRADGDAFFSSILARKREDTV